MQIKGNKKETVEIYDLNSNNLQIEIKNPLNDAKLRT